MSVMNKRILPDGDNKSNNFGDSQTRARYLLAFGFIAPGLFLFFLFLLYPLSNSFYYSLFDWNGFGPPTDFIGTGNYERLADHSIFQTAIQNSFKIVILSVCIQLPLALGLALLVGRGELPGRSIFRTILFIPYVFAEILSALIWVYVFHPTAGLANILLTTIIPGADNVLWLADRNIVLFS